MSISSIHKTKIQGFEALVLRTASLELAMIPSLGAKVVSFVGRRTGREWLWHREGQSWLWANKPGDNFGDGPQAGLDECIPSVSSCRLGETEIADHGDVWARSWDLDENALARHVLRTSVTLCSMPLRFSRSIAALSSQVVEFSYELVNLGDATHPFVWCLHPLFAIYPGDRIELPAEVVSLKLNGGLGVPIKQGDVWSYPEPFPGLRLDHLQCPGGAGACVKGFAGPLSDGRAALLNDRTGDVLSLTWDAAAVPMMGLWLNRGLGGMHHVALEPTHGAPDSLAEAVGDWKRHGTIGPRVCKTWRICWTLSPISS